MRFSRDITSISLCRQSKAEERVLIFIYTGPGYMNKKLPRRDGEPLMVQFLLIAVLQVKLLQNANHKGNIIC